MRAVPRAWSTHAGGHVWDAADMSELGDVLVFAALATTTNHTLVLIDARISVGGVACREARVRAELEAAYAAR